ncbi:MAG: acyl-CoA desaturase [Bacteroidia bacterium]
MQIKFDHQNNAQFFITLKQRVDNYFKDNNISPNANSYMVFKSIVLMLAFYGIYAVILSGALNIWLIFALCIILGLFTAFVGFNISHDATHGSYSKSSKINKILSYTFDMFGASSYMWSIAHNQIHHTYTNIPDHDDDLEPVFLVRLHEEKKLYWIHRYQHYYASFFYLIVSLNWVLFKDYSKMFSKQILHHNVRKIATKDMVILFASKLIYYFMFIVLPMLLGYTWWQVLIGFTVMHFAEGFTLAIVFQLAHVVESTHFPMPDANGTVENNWAVHQLYTTANFARNSKLATFFFGGLNYQVEHHLFPRICHIHYKKISEIVKTTTQEFNIPYNDYKTMGQAIASHYRMLKLLGRNERLSFS